MNNTINTVPYLYSGGFYWSAQVCNNERIKEHLEVEVVIDIGIRTAEE